jgi:hypothetical protein
MLNKIADYFYSLFNNFSKPQTYGSALEQYIVSHSPQTSCDVDRLVRQFNLEQERNTGRLWV